MDSYIDLEQDKEFQDMEPLLRSSTDQTIYSQLELLEDRYKKANYGYQEATKLFRTKQFSSGAEYIVLLYKNMQQLNERAYDMLSDILEMYTDRSIPEDIYRRLGRILYDSHSYC